MLPAAPAAAGHWQTRATSRIARRHGRQEVGNVVAFAAGESDRDAIRNYAAKKCAQRAAVLRVSRSVAKRRPPELFGPAAGQSLETAANPPPDPSKGRSYFVVAGEAAAAGEDSIEGLDSMLDVFLCLWCFLAIGDAAAAGAAISVVDAAAAGASAGDAAAIGAPVDPPLPANAGSASALAKRAAVRTERVRFISFGLLELRAARHWTAGLT